MPYTPPDYNASPSGVSGLQTARDRAIGLLTDRYADDSLTESEFEARLAWLSAADSVARIDALVADLLVPRPFQAPMPGTSSRLPSVEERLLALMSSTTRSGVWTMPHRLVARAVMSELTIDLRHASLPPIAELDLLAVMANVQIIVPPGLAVDCTMSTMMGSVTSEANEPPWSGYAAPRLRVSGSSVMAEVKIRTRWRLR